MGKKKKRFLISNAVLEVISDDMKRCYILLDKSVRRE